MIVDVQKSFEKDISKVTDKKLAIKHYDLIEFLVKCEAITEIPHLKKMSGGNNFYRIRIGNYRSGLKAIDNSTDPQTLNAIN